MERSIRKKATLVTCPRCGLIHSEITVRIVSEQYYSYDICTGNLEDCHGDFSNLRQNYICPECNLVLSDNLF